MFVKNLTNDILTVRKSGKVLKLKPGVNCVDGFWSAEFLKSIYGPQYIICYNEEAKEEVAEVEVKEEKTEEKAETEEKTEEPTYYLNDAGIGTNKHYPIPMHLQDCYKDLGFKEGDFPIAEEISNTQLSIPMYYGMTEEEISYVIEKINAFGR